MKLLRVLFIVLIVLVNLALANPSLASDDPPPYSKNPDYIEVSQALKTLLAAKDTPTLAETYTPEELEQKIAELEFQKYTLETGINWGQCRNETGKTLAVYGPKRKKAKSSYDNVLYFLADGQTTQENWDCDGVYLPRDVKVKSLGNREPGQDLTDAVAIKIVDGTQLVIKANPETDALEFNLPTAKVYKAGEINWFIPDVSQSFVETTVANAPTGSATSD